MCTVPGSSGPQASTPPAHSTGTLTGCVVQYIPCSKECARTAVVCVCVSAVRHRHVRTVDDRELHIAPRSAFLVMDDDLEEMRRLRRSRGYADDRPSSMAADDGQPRTPVSDGAVVVDDDDFGPPMPTQFAVPAAVPPPRKVVDDDDDGDDFGPSLPTAGASHGFAVPAVPEHRPPSATEDNDDDFGPGVSPPTAAPSRSGERADAMSTIEEWRLPVTHEFTMHGHTKAVSALALERSGSRLLTGGYDYMMRLWDFNGMDKRGKAFREVEPDSGQQIVSLSYSYPAPDRVLVVTAASRAKIHDREGRPLVEFARGDMYVGAITSSLSASCAPR